MRIDRESACAAALVRARLVVERVRRDDRGAGPTGRLDRSDDAVVDGDELAEADGDRVRRFVGVLGVVGQLDAGKHEQVVQGSRASGLAKNVRDVRGMHLASYAACRPLRPIEPGIVGADGVIGDAENVEASAAVEVDELAHGEAAVTPRRVRMQLAEERLDSVPHRASLCPPPSLRWAKMWSLSREEAGNLLESAPI